MDFTLPSVDFPLATQSTLNHVDGNEQESRNWVRLDREYGSLNGPSVAILQDMSIALINPCRSCDGGFDRCYEGLDFLTNDFQYTWESDKFVLYA